MTIKEILSLYPQDETETILAHLLNFPKERLYTEHNYAISPAKIKKFKQYINAYNSGLPLAYILGYKYFFGQRYLVSKNTLIPRPESEWLVEKALAQLKKIKLNNPSVLDLGTGSGCLGISVKLNFPKAQITLADISKRALSIAQKNCLLHQVKVNIISSDLFENISGKYDIIIANLPYVPTKDYHAFFQNLKYEPKSALVDPKADFQLYRQFFDQFSTHIRPTGMVLLEIDPSMKTKITEYFSTHKNLAQFKLEFHKDLQSLDRYAIVKN